jgi:hypothetical protein
MLILGVILGRLLPAAIHPHLSAKVELDEIRHLSRWPIPIKVFVNLGVVCLMLDAWFRVTGSYPKDRY